MHEYAFQSLPNSNLTKLPVFMHIGDLGEDNQAKHTFRNKTYHDRPSIRYGKLQSKEIRDRLLLKGKPNDRNFQVGSIIVLKIPRIDRHNQQSKHYNHTINPRYMSLHYNYMIRAVSCSKHDVRAHD
jgi:hypothetical protein